MTQTVLQEICAKKREHIDNQMTLVSLNDVKAMAKNAPSPIGFVNAIKLKSEPALIAEVKKASPSKGVIREDFNPVEIAKIYEENGATCLSVLTDEPYFQGKDEYFKAIRAEVNLPMLRKDFMIDPYQVYEARAMGADCILIIMAALEDKQCKDLHDLAVELNMDVLVEVHDLEELKRAQKLNAHMIGVNNRNLKTLSVDIQTSLSLLPEIPNNVIKVAESGISNPETVKSFHQAGYNAFLVGESLMRQNDIGEAVQILLGK